MPTIDRKRQSDPAQTGSVTRANVTDLAPSLMLSMIPGVGPLLLKELLDRFGTAERVLEAAPSELRSVPRLGPKLSHAIATAKESIDVQGELERCEQHDIKLLTESQSNFPLALAQIPDPPAVLYMQGQLLPRDELAVAIVGTRHASQYGREQARRLAASLARAGITIVSGLARGIDAEAHQASLDAGGRTIAVLGSGLLNIYPSEHKELAKRVTENGALLSEYSTQSKPARGFVSKAKPNCYRTLPRCHCGRSRRSVRGTDFCQAVDGART